MRRIDRLPVLGGSGAVGGGATVVESAAVHLARAGTARAV